MKVIKYYTCTGDKMFVRQIPFYLAVLFLFMSCASADNQLRNDENQKLERACSTVAIMPFTFNEKYPFNGDLIRRDVELAFFKFDCEVVAPNEWDYSLIDSINLVNLTREDCDSISKLLNVDLIITGDFNFDVKSERVRGFGDSITIYKPLLLKAYHSKLKDFILVRREKIRERSGLFVSSGEDFIYKQSDKFAKELVYMGFLKD